MSSDALVMFAKAPVPGRVKTRLAAEIGDAPAADLQAAFIRDLGGRFAGFRGERVLAAAPDTDHPVFRELLDDGWRGVEQGGGDLGQRLERLTRRLLKAGTERVVIIGSDSPTLPMRLVDRALEALTEADVAVGPVFDGGYYLIGTRTGDPAPYRDIPWGTERVFSTTVRRLQAAGLSYRVLPFWYDVDDCSSLSLMADHLGLTGPYGPFVAPATERCLRELDSRDVGGTERRAGWPASGDSAEAGDG